MTLVDETTFENIDLPAKIYKYRNWTKPEHKRLLTDNEIYFSAPLDIDEQHECNLETDYDSVTPDIIYRYAYTAAPDFGIIDEAQRKRFAEDTVKYTPFYDPAHRASMEERARQNMNNSLSIFCVCKHKDNLNLWESFAGGQTGFCVGINTRKMFENKAIFGGGGKVSYYAKKDMPKRKAFTYSLLETNEDMLKVIFSLPDFFAPEDEYRLFKMNINNKQAKIGQDSIEEIVLGHYISEQHKDEIIKISKDRFPQAVILQSKFEQATKKFKFEELK